MNPFEPFTGLAPIDIAIQIHVGKFLFRGTDVL
jgi:hypothetical protein